ncbi:hypothetical protein NFI96_030075, partial [Prochilodus magdalenae]
MGLDQHLFLLDTTRLDLSGLESFYASMLSAWTHYYSLLCYCSIHVWGGLQPTAWVWEEPIFHNKLIPLCSVLSAALRWRFLNAGLCKVGCLWMADGTAWKTAGLLSQQTSIATQRLLGRLLSEVQQALPRQVLDLLDQPQGDTPPPFPPLHVTAADGGWQDSNGARLTFSSPSLGLFEGIDGKTLYVACVKTRHLKDLAEVREHRWQNLLKDHTTAGLSSCSITEEGCAALASALKSNPSHLRELNLLFNKPGESGVKLLSDLLKDPHCKLEKL